MVSKERVKSAVMPLARYREGENMKIVEMIFGSHLYGTSTPDSDRDYKGVFMPSKEQILLNRVPKAMTNNTKKNSDHKNTADDVDVEFYSIQYFIKLACEGQTVALDMLHAPENMLIETSPVWEQIVSNRHMFYTRNLKAFIGYAQRQAAKYGIKGSRLNAAQAVVDTLKKCNADDKLLSAWDSLPLIKHCKMLGPNPNGVDEYQVCGKILQATQHVGYTINILTKFIENYGKRAREAAKNRGIDWKAVSHALRAAYQVKEVLTAKTITFPRPEAEFLTQVKKGKLHYLNDVIPILEPLMTEVEALASQSDLPMKANRKFWDNFLIRAIEENVL